MHSEDQLKEWKELYECFDKDKDGNDKGYMEPKDCWVAIRMLGFNPSEKDLEAFTKEINKKKFQFEDMIKVIDLAGKRDRDSVDEILEAFRIFDKDGNGFISVPELRNLYCNMGEKFSDEEFEDMRKSIDDGSGMVAYEDFVKMMFSS